MTTDRLGGSDGNFAVAPTLAAGKWQIKVSFQDPKAVIATTSKVVNVNVGAKPTTAVNLKSAGHRTGADGVRDREAEAVARSSCWP